MVADERLHRLWVSLCALETPQSSWDVVPEPVAPPPELVSLLQPYPEWVFEEQVSGAPSVVLCGLLFCAVAQSPVGGSPSLDWSLELYRQRFAFLLEEQTQLAAGSSCQE